MSRVHLVVAVVDSYYDDEIKKVVAAYEDVLLASAHVEVAAEFTKNLSLGFLRDLSTSLADEQKAVLGLPIEAPAYTFCCRVRYRVESVPLNVNFSLVSLK